MVRRRRILRLERDHLVMASPLARSRPSQRGRPDLRQIFEPVHGGFGFFDLLLEGRLGSDRFPDVARLIHALAQPPSACGSIRDYWGLNPVVTALAWPFPSTVRSSKPMAGACGCRRARPGANVRFAVPVWAGRRPSENPETAVLFVERKRAERRLGRHNRTSRLSQIF